VVFLRRQASTSRILGASMNNWRETLRGGSEVASAIRQASR
jgi:hypothetical protein